MSNFTEYFDSYKRKTPWIAIARRWNGGKDEFGLSEGQSTVVDAKGDPLYVEVTADNYPKLYQALEEECTFRGIDKPKCYIDKTGNCSLGYAQFATHSIFVQPEAYDAFTKKELRALVAHEVKHFYQGRDLNRDRTLQNEFDSDLAAVDSTDYETIKSYVHKGINLMIDQKVPVQAFRTDFP